MTVLLGTSLQPIDALEQYDAFLAGAGWLRIPVGDRYGGFADAFTERDLEYINADWNGGPILKVSARATPGTDSPSPTEMRLRLAEDPNRMRYPHYLERDISSLHASSMLIPALKPPRNAKQWSRRSGIGAYTWISSVGMLTELDNKGLIEHYSEALANAGWVLDSDGESGPVTWRTWHVTDPQGKSWVGELLVLKRKSSRPGGGHWYLLTIFVYQVM